MSAPTVDLTRVSLSGKTIGVIVAVILIVGFCLMLMWPTVSALGRPAGEKIAEKTTQATAKASPRTQSASAGMM